MTDMDRYELKTLTFVTLYYQILLSSVNIKFILDVCSTYAIFMHETE